MGYLSSKYAVVSMPYTAGDSGVLDNAENTALSGYTLRSPFSRLKFTTTGNVIAVTYFTNIFSSFPSWAQVGIRVNGSYAKTFTAYQNGSRTEYITGLPSGTKTIEVVNGLQSKPSATILGTWVQSIACDQAITLVTTATEPTTLLIYGDSITVGASATTPTQQGYQILVRDAHGPGVAVEAYGFRALKDDADGAPAVAAFVAKLLSAYPSLDTFWLAIGTNDYGQNRWSAADFGTAYAALLDALHAAHPLAIIYCQTPLSRSTETANAYAGTLPDYRTQISTAQSTRAPWAVLIDGTGAAYPGVADLADGVHPTTAGHTTKYGPAVISDLGL